MGQVTGKRHLLNRTVAKPTQNVGKVFGTCGYFSSDNPVFREPIVAPTTIPPGIDGFLADESGDQQNRLNAMGMKNEPHRGQREESQMRHLWWTIALACMCIFLLTGEVRQCGASEREDYLKAKQENRLDTFRAYLVQYPKGKYKRKIKRLMEPLVFEESIKVDTVDAYRAFLEQYPYGKNAREIKKRLEPKLFDLAKSAPTTESCTQYLERFPRGEHAKEVRALLDPLVFKEALDAEDNSDKTGPEVVKPYREYLKRFPRGKHAKEAREKIKWYRTQRATIVCEFPKVVEASGGVPFWEWKTVFRETGGKIGCRLKGSGAIYDRRGRKWVNAGEGHIPRTDLVIPPGGTATDTYWCRSPDHTLCKGYALFRWRGKDAGGHHLSFREKVKLSHTTCPATKK